MCLATGDAELAGAGAEGADVLVEHVGRDPPPAVAGGDGELGRDRRLAGPGRAEQERAGPHRQPAVEQGVERAVAAGQALVGVRGVVLGGDEAGEDVEAAPADQEVVVPAAERDAADLGHPQPPPLGPVLVGQLFEQDDAVARCSPAARRPCPPVRSSRTRTVQSQPAKNCFRARICRRNRSELWAISRSSDRLSITTRLGRCRLTSAIMARRRLAELELGRVEDGQLGVGRQVLLGRDQLAQLDAGQVPPVAPGDAGDLGPGLGQRDVQARLAPADAVEQELERERRLARAGRPGHEVHAVGREAAAEDVVQARDAGRHGRVDVDIDVDVDGVADPRAFRPPARRLTVRGRHRAGNITPPRPSTKPVRQPNRWGTNRLRFPVTGDASSRTPTPAAYPLTIHDPTTGVNPSNVRTGTYCCQTCGPG